MATLSHAEARRFYDRFGSRQDRQAFYEDPALAVLVEHAALGETEVLVELGCGTGRLAERLLERNLPQRAHYHGFDVSSTMVELTRTRLARFGERVTVSQTHGEMRLPVDDRAADRFVATYVLDILSPGDIGAAIDEAARVLVPGGLVCVTTLGPGRSLLARLLAGAWSLLHRLRPSLVGGCRPLEPAEWIGPPAFELVHHSGVEAWAVPSEVVVARRRE